MPGKDETRWEQAEDGSWSRRSLVTDDEEDVQATPAAVEAADDYGVDLASVSGSGKGGKITKADIEAAASDEKEE